MTDPHSDLSTEQDGGPPPHEIEDFTLTVLEGPSVGRIASSDGSRCSIGSHPSNDLVLADTTVSRFHCELVSVSGRTHLRDVGSLNGTFVQNIEVKDAVLRNGCLIRLGKSCVRFDVGARRKPLPLSSAEEFGRLVGGSALMRRVYFLLERAASSDATVLIEGETGTGKDAAAESVHAASGRKGGPYVVVDCGAIPSNLMESELFGHERGAFTGATGARAGAFEQAHGGSIFLDEIGELPIDLQPKLLRVLDQRTLQRVGGSERRTVDVRIIAATHRDLRQAVNRGFFREDLYFRLAVLRIPMPPLRDRSEDIPIVARVLVGAMGADPVVVQKVITPAFVDSLRRGAWPGNVRELRNYLEQCVALAEPVPLTENQTDLPAIPDSFDRMPSYDFARQRTLHEFERRFMRWLLRRYGDNLSEAARAVGLNRRHLYRLRDRHQL